MIPPDPSPRQRVLDASERLFLDSGYGRFTMDALALELGMSKKTLYKLFDGKDELLAEVLDVRAARIDAEMTALLARDEPDFAKKLVTFVEYTVERFAEVSEPFLKDVRRSAPPLFKKIEAFRDQAIPRHVERLLAEGAAAGVFRKDIPFPVVVGVLLHAARNLLLPRRGRARLLGPPRELADQIVRVVCEGIIVR